MRTINIIGCGPSANLWPGTGESLGVNDCEKTGKKVDSLLVIDWPLKFSQDRFNVIANSQAKFYTHLMAWEKYKPNMELFHMNRWRGALSAGKINHSSTSPFVAVTLAWTWGYQEMILWGVDFNDHRNYGKQTENFTQERNNYRELVRELAKDGVKVFHGSEGSALDFIEVKQQLVNG